MSTPVLNVDSSRADASTRERVLAHIVQAGPITAAELAEHLDLTAAGIRRHLGVLEADGLITERDVTGGAPQRRRGRPARAFVVTDHGQESLTSGYADIATQALAFLERRDPDAVAEFATDYLSEMEARVRAVTIDAPGIERLEALVAELTASGYAASARPIGRTRRLQLCQGHCPVQVVATRFPELCEAEAAMFSRVLGVPVQRLATLAEGAHVCTTNVPIRAKGTR